MMITKNSKVATLAHRGEFPVADKFANTPRSHAIKRSRSRIMRTIVPLSLLLSLALTPSAQASIAYGSINNFDTVNDTGETCHGFEIEIDDVHSKDITYTYDYNHYGVPKITEDGTDPLHPKVIIRYESGKKPDGTWAAFTSIPAGPITPTDGHQFTNPSVNFGGEHFGVGFYGTPSAVKYNWLKDDGTGKLTYAGAVNISTPAFAYAPPAGGVAAQVRAAIVPPPEVHALEFGVASWVKETRTSSHNNKKVELKDLVSEDPNDPNAKNWKNGEPDEVEVEWQLFQTDFNANKGGANGEIDGANEDLKHGDEVITRRYDFYKYVGPIDPESGEALADTVGPDGIHGVGIANINGVDVDLSTVVVVGDYIGAQMAGFDAQGKIGLIDHLQDGDINVPYVERTIVVGGVAPVVTTMTGALPNGMSFNKVTGFLSGTPKASGLFAFTIHSTDAKGGNVTTTFSLTIKAKAVLISGIIDLDNCTNLVQAISCEFRTTAGVVLFTRNVTLAADGSFSITDAPAGSYSVHIKGAKWLAKNVLVNTTKGAVSNVSPTLLAGDVNGDNYVGLDDLGLLADAFDTAPGDALWNDAADLNCDGVVGLDDLGLLALNFDTAGDP